MRKLLTFLLIVFSLIFLSACQAIDDYFDSFFEDSPPSQDEDDPSAISPIVDPPDSTVPVIEEDLLSLTKMIETRDVLREANLYIETDQFRTIFGNRLSKSGTTQGSGFIFYQEGSNYYVLTNYHILVSEGLTRGQTSRIETLSNEDYTASLIAYDASVDLAVLRFTTNTYKGHIFDLNARQSPPLNHEFILATGNPQSVRHMVTYGIFISMYTISSVDFDVIYHSAILHPGSSGGALTDINGHILGINTWSASGSDVDNFAIPLSIIIDFLEKNGLAY